MDKGKKMGIGGKAPEKSSIASGLSARGGVSKAAKSKAAARAKTAAEGEHAGMRARAC